MPARRRRALLSVLAAVVTTGSVGHAQDARKCEERLRAPTADSGQFRVMIDVRSLDSKHPVSAPERTLIAEGIRAYFRPPRPIPLDTYSTSDSAKMPRPGVPAHLVAFAAYRVELSEEGKFSQLSITGGNRNELFDSVFVAALSALGASEALPPLELGGRVKSVPLSLVVSTIDAMHESEADSRHDAQRELFSFRSPLLPVSSPVQQIPRTGNLRYPDELRRQNVEGELTLDFVVEADGRAAPSSTHPVAYTHPSFVLAVLEALPGFRFHPAEIDGCPVRFLVRQPFTFSLR